ncbi:MAG: hypothetical protein PHZ00_01925 [Candidatus Peribacteraceae bacterium]|nr:hypothetical protein [Candidatus Peribacteraceae bacterium]
MVETLNRDRAQDGGGEVDSCAALQRLTECGKIEEYNRLMGPGGKAPCPGILQVWKQLMGDEQIPLKHSVQQEPRASSAPVAITDQTMQEARETMQSHGNRKVITVLGSSKSRR